MMLKRTFVIGDIHGALKALKQCINLIKITSNDHLIFLGDYVDGWSESADVIEYLIQLQNNLKCTFVKGNHDVMCIDFLKGEQMSNSWFYHGGEATVASYDKSDFEKEKHIEFLERLQNFYIDEENRLFIHAGFSSMHGPTNEEYESNYYWDRTLLETALSFNNSISKESPFYPKRFLLFKEIYIGHTSTLKYESQEPINKINLWNIDTGAAYTGRLTAINIETKEIYQSEVVTKLYPNEKGRN